MSTSENGGTDRMKGSKVLLAYPTRSGKMRAIAKTLLRNRNAVLFWIDPANPSPEVYEQHFV